MSVNLSGETRLIPIIGDPIKYAKSPHTLSASLAAKGRNMVCVPMQVLEADLDDVMRGLTRIPNVDGLLVTMPHKSNAFKFCSTGSETARLLGCVSVMRRNTDGSWDGDMLDGLSFVKAQIDAGAKPKGARVLLVGAGAAGAAIAIALLDADVRELIIHDVDEARVARLIELVPEPRRSRMVAGTADPSGCDMVCNATPMGLNADDPLPVPADSLASSMFVGDVIAGHGVTPFLKAAQSAGCKTANGMRMVQSGQDMMVDFMLGN
jgi:shikimate dehydrogenase